MKIRSIMAMMAFAIFCLCACGTGNASAADTANENNSESKTMTDNQPDTASVKVRMETTMGNITLLLYGDTPKHRDNFVRLVRDHYYDGTLFHRVIKDFMVQAGDPDSRTAGDDTRLGSGGPDYKIDAEIVYPKYFHKRGALAAARQGDMVNPMRQSSGSQFYIVTGNRYTAEGLAQIEQNMRATQVQSNFNTLVTANRDNILEMQRNGNRAGLQQLQDSLISQARRAAEEMPSPLTEEMRQAYTTVGGAPHLDGQYTVFGEVIEGMDTVERIEATETGAADRPRQDVRIRKMEII